MTITIDLPPEVADALGRKAAQEGSDVAGYVRRLAVRNFDGSATGQDNSTELPAPRTPGLHALPLHHKDPFDRLLIAQALVEGLPAASADFSFSAYPISVIR